MKQAIYKTQRKGIRMLYFRELRRATLSLKKLHGYTESMKLIPPFAPHLNNRNLCVKKIRRIHLYYKYISQPFTIDFAKQKLIIAL